MDGRHSISTVYAQRKAAFGDAVWLHHSHAHCRFEKLLQQRDELLKASMNFLLYLKENLPFGKDPQNDEWISAQATRAMENFPPVWPGDMVKTSVMGIIRWKGLHFASSMYVTLPTLSWCFFSLTCHDSALPRFLDKRVRFDDRADFAIGLLDHKEELIDLPEVEGHSRSNEELLDHILDSILEEEVPRVSSQRTHVVSTVSSLLSICIPGNRMNYYGDLLGALILSPCEERFYTRYCDLYAEMIPGLVKLLGEHGIKVSSSPSRNFFCHIIGTYLEEILGSEEGSPYLKFSMLTCGHEVCGQINDFLRSEETRMTIETEWGATSDCIKDLKIDGRYSLLEVWHRRYAQPPSTELVKKHEAEAAQHWSVRLNDARELLGGIGTDEEIFQIMGEWYSDVEKALEGSQAFVTSKTRRGPETGDAMVGIE